MTYMPTPTPTPTPSTGSGKTIYLTAQWGPLYHLTYDGNENTGGTDPVDSHTYRPKKIATVLGKGTLVKDGYEFEEWDITNDGSGTVYQPGSSLQLITDTTLYAIWLQTFKITYVGNGNTSGAAPIDPKTYKTNVLVSILTKETLLKEGYQFKGWNTDPGGSGTFYVEGASTLMPDHDLTLYGVWYPNSMSDKRRVIKPPYVQTNEFQVGRNYLSK